MVIDHKKALYHTKIMRAINKFLSVTDVLNVSIYSIAAFNKILKGQMTPNVNPYHAEFLKWNNPPYIFGIFHYHF